MYNVILWKDNGDENFHVFKHKPTFDDLYKLIGCSLIEIIKGYNPEISNRSFEMYIDEEGSYKTRGDPMTLTYPNKRATIAWYEWQKRTNRQSLPGDKIVGHAAIVRKVKDEHKDSIKDL